MRLKFTLTALTLSLGGVFLLSGCATNDFEYEPQELSLTLLHTNDTHANLIGSDAKGKPIYDSKNSIGGYGRVARYLKDHMTENTLALDAGDQFQGTLFYTLQKSALLHDVDTVTPWHAMTLGNHEFDGGCKSLAEFIDNSPTPILAANIKKESACPVAKSPIESHKVFMIDQTPVAVIGIANDETNIFPTACPHTAFTDPVETLKKEVALLQKEGIRHIIALTHLGFDRDRLIARSVSGIDVIVGGHSHTYLDKGSVDGPYPMVEKTPAGEPVLIVQAGFSAQHIGHLNLRFNKEGVLTAWEGQPVKLENAYPQDAAIENIQKRALKTVEGYRNVKLTYNPVQMADGMDACREETCLVGAVTALAFKDHAKKYGTAFALINGGACRASLPQGTISRGDVMDALPFTNYLCVIELKGKDVLAALEHGASGSQARGAPLLQVAGLTYTIDAKRKAGHRISRVFVTTTKGKKRPLRMNQTYRVALPDYLADGRDGYAMFKKAKKVYLSKHTYADVLESYLKKHPVLKRPKDGFVVKR